MINVLNQIALLQALSESTDTFTLWQPFFPINRVFYDHYDGVVGVRWIILYYFIKIF